MLTGKKLSTAGSSAIIITLTGLVYLQTLTFGFVFDDVIQISDNKWLRDIAYIPDILTSSGFSYSGEESNSYRPLLHLVFMFNYHVAGLDPWFYHLVNITIHFMNGILVFLLARFIFIRDGSFPGLSGDKGSLPALTAALFFTLNPVNVEVGSWVSAIPELSFTFFLLLSLYIYIRRGGLTSAVLSPLAFFIALLGKETAVALLLIIPLYDTLYGGGLRKNLKRYIPFALFFILYLIIRIKAIVTSVDHMSINLTPFEVIINAFSLFSMYVGKVIFPVNLNAFYGLEPIRSFSDPLVPISILLTLLYGLLIYRSRRVPLLLFTLLWFIFPLLPALYYPAVSYGAFYERYMYCSTIGYAIFLAWFFFKLIGAGVGPQGRPPLRRAVVLFVPLLIVTFGISSAVRAGVWKSEYTLWQDTAEKSPSVSFAQYSYAVELSKKGEKTEAVKYYKRAIEADRERVGHYINLASLYIEIGEKDRAVELLEDALVIDPKSGDVYYMLASLYFEDGDRRGALKEFIKVTVLDPANMDAWYNAAWLYSEAGMLEESVSYYREVLRYNDNAHDARYNLARVLLDMGRDGEAREELETLLSLVPDYMDGRELLNNILR